jgi:dihydroorotate dehydrogenase electron transfer subunit
MPHGEFPWSSCPARQRHAERDTQERLHCLNAYVIDTLVPVPDNAGRETDVKQFDAEVLFNREVSPAWKLLAFSWPATLPAPEPGQFFTFRPSLLDAGDSGLLRRPLAFAGFDAGAAWALYQVRGGGTRALAATGEGAGIDLIAPLGNAFPLPLDGEHPVLLGGGIGIGPMLFLASVLKAAGNPDPGLVLGFRSSGFIPGLQPLLESCPGALRPALAGLSSLLASATIATDDGSAGLKGTVIDALQGLAAMAGSCTAHYYACGPEPMLAAIEARAENESSPLHISVEQWMACGVGACQGCVLPDRTGGYVRACADGPVFKGGRIRWS